MSTDFTLNANGREDTGKGASRRLRRLAGEVPAIVYGGKKAPTQISLALKDVTKALGNEAFFSHIVGLIIDGISEDVIIKDIQRHPSKSTVMHMDFFRVNKTTKLQTKAPLHFINEEECVGVKVGGGQIAHSMTELEISCLPQNLPEYLEVDMTAVELGQTLHISDIKLPKGVESVALSHGEDHDLPIAAVNKPKAAEEISDEAPEAPKTEEDSDEEASEE